jgi:hypothetical protein
MVHDDLKNFKIGILASYACMSVCLLVLSVIVVTITADSTAKLFLGVCLLPSALTYAIWNIDVLVRHLKALKTTGP